MAEQLQIRRVKLSDGTTAEYDGKALTLTGVNGEKMQVELDGADDEAALIWLIGGYTPRRGQKARQQPRASRKGGPDAKGKDAPTGGVVEPPAGAVPAP